MALCKECLGPLLVYRKTESFVFGREYRSSLRKFISLLYVSIRRIFKAKVSNPIALNLPSRCLE